MINSNDEIRIVHQNMRFLINNVFFKIDNSLQT